MGTNDKKHINPYCAPGVLKNNNFDYSVLKHFTMDDVINEVKSYFHKETITLHNREWEQVEPRYISFFLLKNQRKENTLKKIAEKMELSGMTGNTKRILHHTTVIYGIRKISNFLNEKVNDEKTVKAISSILNNLSQKIQQ